MEEEGAGGAYGIGCDVRNDQGCAGVGESRRSVEQNVTVSNGSWRRNHGLETQDEVARVKRNGAVRGGGGTLPDTLVDAGRREGLLQRRWGVRSSRASQ